MDGIFLENFRAIRSPTWVKLAPITLLVGENSAAKSSFLAALRLAWELSYGRGRVDFNSSPFQLGSYDQIAHYRGGRSGRAKSFKIGLRDAQSGSSGPILEVVHTFQSGVTEPEIKQVDVQVGQDSISLGQPTKSKGQTATVKSGRYSDKIPLDEITERFKFFTPAALGDVFFLVRQLNFLQYEERVRLKKRTTEILDRISRTYDQLAHTPSQNRPYAFAPVRTEPQRTYNPLSETPVPQGAHVPMILAKAFSESKADWHEISDALRRFGKESEMFSELKIKRLGKKGADPFQLTVQISGPPKNILDVGYGVSQVLPFVVDIARLGQNRTFLLQQPEVHLHPKAQAALGTFFVEQHLHSAKEFIVETHSDYLVNRIRLAAKDRLDPADVKILYFERCGPDVEIFELEIDREGNVLNAPSSYRQFFLAEERGLLGIE